MESTPPLEIMEICLVCCGAIFAIAGIFYHLGVGLFQVIYPTAVSGSMPDAMCETLFYAAGGLQLFAFVSQFFNILAFLNVLLVGTLAGLHTAIAAKYIGQYKYFIAFCVLEYLAFLGGLCMCGGQTKQAAAGNGHTVFSNMRR